LSSLLLVYKSVRATYYILVPTPGNQRRSGTNPRKEHSPQQTRERPTESRKTPETQTQREEKAANRQSYPTIDTTRNVPLEAHQEV